MNQNITSPVKGMKDLLPEQVKHLQYLETIFKNLLLTYNYKEIRIPVLEKLALFQQLTDVLPEATNKEMFSFYDKDDKSEKLTLRPEGTISCLRASVKNALVRNNNSQRLWYIGPMFRRERPQKGRYRQFFQIGVESYNIPEHKIDIEHIIIFKKFLTSLGLNHCVRLEINNIGMPKDREIYKIELIKYFKKQRKRLTTHIIKQLINNPFKALDDKSETLKPIILKAPKLELFTSNKSKKYFSDFINNLKILNINFIINNTLVRGLDYYNLIVYEWVSLKIIPGISICGGGRYDNLSEKLKYKNIFSTGFALGLDRIMLLSNLKNNPKNNLDCYIIYHGQTAKELNLILTEEIRKLCPKFNFLTNYHNVNYKKHINIFQKENSKCVVIINIFNILNSTITIKNSCTETIIKLANLYSFFGNFKYAD